MWKSIIILIFSVVWALKAAEDIGIEKKTKTGCNSTIDKNNSAFALDIHNLSEPCYWNISSTKSPGPINLFFSEIILHEGDKLSLYKSMEDAEAGKSPLNEKPINSQNGTLTIITEEEEIVLWLSGDPVAFDRIFDGYYSVNACSIPVPPEVEILHQPTYLGNINASRDCEYRFNQIAHKRVKQVFSFMEYNMPGSHVRVEGSTLSGDYESKSPTDFFIDGSMLKLTVTQAVNSSDNFSLKIHEVDSACSGKYTPAALKQLISPANEMNNGTIESECRWLIDSSKSIVGLKFDTLDFKSVFDIAAINDGHSEFSSPLLQVTTSNRNKSQTEMIRTSGSGLWVSFKPLSYESRFIASVSEHDQGGHFKDGAIINIKGPAADDTVFLLEVEAGMVVKLNVLISILNPPATLSIYDGFDTSQLLTSISSQIKYPVLSKSNKMMIITTNFSAASNSFQAKVEGVKPGCDHMSSVDSDNYLLSENCNSTCKWIIPPQNPANSIAIIDLQFISLQVGDSIKIQKLDPSLTVLGQIDANVTHVPQIVVPSNIGALITVTQGVCKEKKERIVLIGHSSFVPSCNEAISLKASESYHISSPMYPDTYPVFASCHWNISVPKEAIVHISFQTFNLANNHCLKISQNEGKPIKYEGKTLPTDDLFLPGDVQIEFDSSGCDKPAVGNTLSSDLGFLFNVTVADCGAILEGKNAGSFNTNISGNNSICLWKVVVPPAGGDAVNIISFSVNGNHSQNDIFTIYDGTTVRDSEITNDTVNTEIWSRTDTLIFVYRRMNVSQPTSNLTVKYETITCNKSMQCDNKICMHPDWRCNGENECGDYTDEKNCGAAPLPPPTTPSPPSPSSSQGYSSTTLGLSIFFMLVVGAILGLTVPVCYRKYRDSQYRRFHDLEG